MFPGHCAKGRSEESILQASFMATQVAVATAAQVGAGAEYETGEKGAGGPSFQWDWVVVFPPTAAKRIFVFEYVRPCNRGALSAMFECVGSFSLLCVPDLGACF